MPFGLRNAVQSFQRFINRVMSDLDFIFNYLDDILIFSSTPEEHEKHFRIVLERLKESGLRLNLSKCELGKSEIVFLSHLVNHEGSKPCAEKVEAILEYPKPSTVADLHRFLGMINFFRRSIPHAAAIQAPLYEYMHNTKKNDQTPMAWTPEAEQAFEQCKTSLAKATLLSNPSTEAETRLVTDASDFAMGASLEQYIDNIWKSLAFFSRKFSSSQRNYSAYDRELTAVYESIKYFKYFLEGRNFKIVTDHKPLVYAFSQKADKASPHQCRQLCFISKFTTAFEYLPGSANVAADALSQIDMIRLPLEIEMPELAELQKDDAELAGLLTSSNTSLILKCIELGHTHSPIYCDSTGKILRPYIPKSLRKQIFDRSLTVSSRT